MRGAGAGWAHLPSAEDSTLTVGGSQEKATLLVLFEGCETDCGKSAQYRLDRG